MAEVETAEAVADVIVVAVRAADAALAAEAIVVLAGAAVVIAATANS